jgi:hypothetical protein
MLVGQHRTHEAHHSPRIGKDTDHIGTPLDFLIEALDSVVAIHLFYARRR